MKLNGKSRSNTVQKPISIKKLAGPVLVLLAAVGIGMVIREFRFRSSGEEHVSQAPKAVQPADLPEIQNIQEQLPIEEVFVEPEPLAPEAVGPPPLPTAKAQPQQDPRLNDPVFKEQLGRYVLSFVGKDPASDEIWATLINDPSLSGQVRQDLI